MRTAILLSLLALPLLGCGGGDGDTVQGYVEGDFVLVGLPASGRVTTLSVERGDTVAAGQGLFALDDTAEKAALAEAEARVREAEHQRDNLLTGRRNLEIKALEQQRDQAEASLRLSLLQEHRQEEMIKSGATSHEKLDQARSDTLRDRARVAELTSDIAFAREGGRSAEIAAANANVAAEQAALDRAAWNLHERTATAPASALVDDVLFRPGEEVAAGQAVISLLPPGNIKLRFYLPPKGVARVHPGAILKVACPGCPASLTARVARIAAEASYAPPVLYSREGQDKLVFLVEARPTADPERFHPGQPVTLTLPGKEEGR